MASGKGRETRKNCWGSASTAWLQCVSILHPAAAAGCRPCLSLMADCSCFTLTPHHVRRGHRTSRRLTPRLLGTAGTPKNMVRNQTQPNHKKTTGSSVTGATQMAGARCHGALRPAGGTSASPSSGPRLPLRAAAVRARPGGFVRLLQPVPCRGKQEIWGQEMSARLRWWKEEESLCWRVGLGFRAGLVLMPPPVGGQGQGCWRGACTPQPGHGSTVVCRETGPHHTHNYDF